MSFYLTLGLGRLVKARFTLLLVLYIGVGTFSRGAKDEVDVKDHKILCMD